MTQLFRVTAKNALEVSESPFLNETVDLEDFVIGNPVLLGEGTTIVARQIDAGAAGRLDLLAVSRTPTGGQVAVIELKNAPADAHVLLQALRYASWAVGNPDSMKLLLSRARIPNLEEIDLRPRVVIVSQAIQDELVELSQYVEAFEFDFIEVKRFSEGNDLYVAVTRKAPTASSRAVVSSRQEWDWERYRDELGWREDRISSGRRLVERLEEKISSRSWPLSWRFRKGYIPFQLGGTKNVFAIEPKTLRTWWLWFRLPRPPAKIGLPRVSLESVWNQDFKTFSIVITDPEEDLDQFDEYFNAAYGSASGTT